MKRRKPFKLSRLPAPGVGVVVSMREPTIPQLRQLRAQLDEHAGKPVPKPPVPRRLYLELRALIDWAAWSLDLTWTPERIKLQRFWVVVEGLQLAERKGLKTGRLKFAYRHAVRTLKGHPAECGIEMMRKSYEAARDAAFE